MYNKKAMIVPVLGTVLVVFAIVVASVIGLVIGPTFQGEAMQKGGLGISIHNHAEFWIKALDESIQIISRRSAYDLGKSGGIIGPKVFTWFIGYPSMNTLQKNLEAKIKDSLPQGTIKAERTIEWSSGFIDILDYKRGTSDSCGDLIVEVPGEECDDGNNIDGDGCSSTCLIEDLAFLSTCGTIRNSKCFFVKGNKSFSISDEDIEAKISLYPHKFYSQINSSYFKLLYVGRQILDNPIYSSLLNDIAALESLLQADFADLDFQISSLSGNIIEITITDKSCLPTEFYCLAPLKPGEDGIILGGKEIPYDFLELKFRVDLDNLIAPPTCTRSSPTITITPSTQTGSKGSSLTYNVNVKNNDGSDCGDSIFDLSTVCPSGFICTLSRNSLTISPDSTDSTTITVSSTLLTPSGTHMFEIKTTNSGETDYWKADSANYVIPKECTIQTECAQECDNLGIDFKWHGRNCVSGICSIYEIWSGTCPEGDENCMTGQCCMGECQSNKCVCSHTNYVDVYGSRCPSGQTCGEDCYCHPTSTCTADLTTTVMGSGPCTVSLFMSTSGCDRQIWEIRNSTGQVCAGIVSNPVSCPAQTVPLGSHIYSLYINGIRKDSEEAVCVIPTCVGDVITSVFDPGTGTCTIGSSLIPYNCETKNWEIRDADNNVRCLGTLPDTNCPAQWSFSGTTYTYLYIDGELKSTKTDTCKAGPTCSAVLSTIQVSGEGSCTFLADFSHANCDSKSWEIKDKDTSTIVCSKTLPDNSCQWNVLSGASGTTYNYELWIDGSLQDIDSARCNPECLSNSDCDDGSRCTDNICDNGICKYPPKPAGTVFATKSGYCPPYCSGNTKYTPSVLKTCDRVCDGVSANEPDCDYTVGCTPSDYSSQSCGTTTRTCSDYCSEGTKYIATGNTQCNNGCADSVNCASSCTAPACSYTSQSCGTSTITCPDKCEGGIEYRDGHTTTCNLGCADSVNCASSCTASSCGSSDYDTKKTCYSSCNGDRCTWVYLCNEASDSKNEFQCLDCCDWGGCTAPYNCGCSIPAQTRTEFQSNPSCYYYWDCCTGWTGPICYSCGWCRVDVTASCSYSDACTYGKFCQKQTKSYSDSCQCCALGCNTYTATNSCTTNAQCAYPGSEPTCTYYTDYKCDCVLAVGYNFRWESSATFTATCS